MGNIDEYCAMPNANKEYQRFSIRFSLSILLNSSKQFNPRIQSKVPNNNRVDISYKYPTSVVDILGASNRNILEPLRIDTSADDLFSFSLVLLQLSTSISSLVSLLFWDVKYFRSF